MTAWEWYRRLVPLRPYGDLGRGFAAEIADPVWFLGRQWQLGEHQGEDASSPVLVQADVSHMQLAPLDGVDGGSLDPTLVPGEVLIEAESDSWWTIGRRIRIGAAAAALLPAVDLGADVRFAELPEPYQHFAGNVDGLAIRRAALLPDDHPLWRGVPIPAPDHWRPTDLDYQARFQAGTIALTAPDHDGGDVDWFTVDAAGPVGPPTERRLSPVIPSRLQFPGAPLPRWWQIEDGHVDIGGFAPDRSHFATALLLEASVVDADDWFTFPVPPAPTTGAVVTIHGVTVKDSFDQWWILQTPPAAGDPLGSEPGSDRAWSLFRTTNLDRRSLVVWPAAVAPLSGPVLDEILLGVDEDANLLWAVELRADGVVLSPDAESLAGRIETTTTGTRNFLYLPSSTLPPHWHPYRIESPAGGRIFVQGLVADLTKDPPEARDGPRSRMIGGAPGQRYGLGHQLSPHAVPNDGLKLERRAMLARRTDGQPSLWVQRRRLPLLGGPVSYLRFDVAAESPQAAEVPK
jgi:hypothetical protein